MFLRLEFSIALFLIPLFFENHCLANSFEIELFKARQVSSISQAVKLLPQHDKTELVSILNAVPENVLSPLMKGVLFVTSTWKQKDATLARDYFIKLEQDLDLLEKNDSNFFSKRKILKQLKSNFFDFQKEFLSTIPDTQTREWFLSRLFLISHNHDQRIQPIFQKLLRSRVKLKKTKIFDELLIPIIYFPMAAISLFALSVPIGTTLVITHGNLPKELWELVGLVTLSGIMLNNKVAGMKQEKYVKEQLPFEIALGKALRAERKNLLKTLFKQDCSNLLSPLENSLNFNLDKTSAL